MPYRFEHTGNPTPKSDRTNFVPFLSNLQNGTIFHVFQVTILKIYLRLWDIFSSDPPEFAHVDRHRWRLESFCRRCVTCENVWFPIVFPYKRLWKTKNTFWQICNSKVKSIHIFRYIWRYTHVIHPMCVSHTPVPIVKVCFHALLLVQRLLASSSKVAQRGIVKLILFKKAYFNQDTCTICDPRQNVVIQW